MSICLNQNKLLLTALGALAVIAGVVLKNSSKQMGRSDSFYGKWLGPMFFIGGWVLVAYSVAGNSLNLKSGLAWASAATIVLAVMMIIQSREKNPGANPPMVWPILFILGWLAFAYSVGMGSNMKLLITFSSAALVLASMMYFLPKQRKKCVVDGPGWALFALAWAGIAAANAM